MPNILNKNQALFIAEQIAALTDVDLIDLNIDALTWRIKVPHPSQKLMTWITIVWEGYDEARGFRTIQVDHPNATKGGEVHQSLAAFRAAYGLTDRDRWRYWSFKPKGVRTV